VSAPHDGGAHDEVEPVGAGVEAEPDEDAVVDELTHVVVDDPPVAAGEADLATALAQRDEYLDALQRVKAEFDNFRKRTERQRADLVARAAEDLARSLLPVLDACEAAQAQGAVDVDPIAKVLLETLEKEGLARLGAAGDVFDPTLHEAVMHEAADEALEQPQIAEVLRGGYLWKGAVLRTAMVKVRG
jgi:molecular chaperone GrpE